MKLKLIAFFKLIRWFHELLAILPFLALYFVISYYAKKNNLNCNLSGINFILICICVQLLIAAGCVLNDIMDREIDRINKPLTYIVGNTLSLKTAKTIFISLSFCIIILSTYISYHIFSEWAYISTLVYLLSLLYDMYFKRSPLLGNILMALLSAFIPLVLFFFAKDCILLLNNENLNLLIYLYAGFPFLIIIPRELSLDISDLEGDKACGCKTLPIVIGVSKSKLVVSAFTASIIVLSFFISHRYSHLTITFLVIDVLLIYYIVKLYKIDKRIQYIQIGRFLWFTMIIGLIGFTLSTLYLT